jgi:hypothetical protein
MTTTYRVEVHDGKHWAFGVHIDRNKRIPVFCNLDFATTGSQAEMEQLLEQAQRICGGTLRVAAIDA